jgi:hypothetical protein
VEAEQAKKLRESLTGGLHNSRSTKSTLKSIFPSFHFPAEMTEEDELYQPNTDRAEDAEAMIRRLREGFDDCLDRSRGCTCEHCLFRSCSHFITLYLCQDDCFATMGVSAVRY